jgi:hypothetical protein
MVLREGFADENPKEHEVKGNKIIGYRSVYKLTRKLRQPDGTWRDTTVTSSYSTMEAYQAQLMGNSKKENWVKYPRKMVGHRALSFGARLIGADIMLGMHETSEMADVAGLAYKVIDVDHVEIIPNTNTESTSNQPANEEVKEEGTSQDSAE